MDIGAPNWSEDDNSNVTAAPDGAPEGMAPSGVNNVLRAHQGAIKRFYTWSTPRPTGGTGSAYTLTYGVAPGALVDGMTHLVQFGAANAGAPTLNVNGLGAIPLHYYAAGAWRAVPAALWAADEVLQVAYHGSSGAYRLIGLHNGTGEIAAYAGTTAPAGTLLCHGQAIGRTAYAGLFAALGTTHGAGDGSTTFNLPDLRGRVPVGKSDMGGVDAGNLAGGSGLGAGLGGQYQAANTTVSGTLNGSASGTVTTTGPINGQGNSVGGGAGQSTDWNHQHNATINISASVSGSLFGTSGTFSIVQPSRVINYLIRI
jgi:microcystin-dependent protein